MSDNLEPKFNLMALPTKTPTPTRTPTKTPTRTRTLPPPPRQICFKIPVSEYTNIWNPFTLQQNPAGLTMSYYPSVPFSPIIPLVGNGPTYAAGPFFVTQKQYEGNLRWFIYSYEQQLQSHIGIASPGVKVLYVSEASNINGLYTPMKNLSANISNPVFNNSFRSLSSYQLEYGKFSIITQGVCSYVAPTQTPTPTKTRSPYTSQTPTPSRTQTGTVTRTPTNTPSPTRTQNFNPTTVISLSGISGAFSFRNAYDGLEQLIFTNGILTGLNRLY
jgi:hypothetical protein